MVRTVWKKGDIITPLLTVDGIVFVGSMLVLVRRRNKPFKGQYALPGGFVEPGETVEQAVVREVEEETGLKTRVKKLFGVYSDPQRDPRGHVVTIVYLLDAVGGSLRSGDDAAGIKLFPLSELPKLAFDHEKIIRDFIKRELK